VVGHDPFLFELWFASLTSWLYHTKYETR